MAEISRKIGRLAEGKFIGKAIELGIPILYPLVEGLRYDFVIDRNGLHRVQVKGTAGSEGEKFHFYPSTPNSSGSGRNSYSVEDMDFMAVYLQTADIWYILPSSVIAGKKHVVFFPKGKSTYNEYLEAWELL